MARSAHNPMDAVADRMMRRLDGGAVAGRRSTAGARGLGRLVARAEGRGPVGDAQRTRLLDRLAERNEGEVAGASLSWIGRDLRRLRTPLAASGVSEDALVWLALAQAPEEAVEDGQAALLPGEPILRTIQGWSSRPKAERKAPSRPVARAFGRVRRPSSAGGQVAAAAAVATGKTRSRLLTAIDLLEAMSPREASRMAEVLLAGASVPSWKARSASADGRSVSPRSARTPSRPSQAAVTRAAQAAGRAVRPPPSGARSRRTSALAAPPTSAGSRASSDGAGGDAAGPSRSGAGPRSVAVVPERATVPLRTVEPLTVAPPTPWAAEPVALPEGPLLRAVGRLAPTQVSERGSVEREGRSLVPRPVGRLSASRVLANDDRAPLGGDGPAFEDRASPAGQQGATGPASEAGGGGVRDRAVARERSPLGRTRAVASRAEAVAEGAPGLEGSTPTGFAQRRAEEPRLPGAGLGLAPRRTRLAAPEAVWLEATTPDTTPTEAGEGVADVAFGEPTTRTIQGWSSRAPARQQGGSEGPTSSQRVIRPRRDVASAGSRAALRGELTGQVASSDARPARAPSAAFASSPSSATSRPTRAMEAAASVSVARVPREVADAVVATPAGRSREAFGAEVAVAPSSVQARTAAPRGVDAALARVAWAPRSAAASAAAFGAAPDAVLADGASVADASPLRRAVPPVVRADVQAAGLQRALSRTEATAVEGSTASRLRRAGAESVEGAAMRDATADGDAPRAMARLEATVRAPRLGVPFAETLSAQVPADGVAATLPLGAPGEGRVVRTATRAASSVTVRVPMRAGRALQVAGRDGLDVGTWMRWRASAVRGDAPASVTVEGEGATEVAAQIARWERVRGVAGAMARPTGPLLPPTVARSSSQGPARENAPSTAPILATADAAAYAPSTLSEAGDVRLPSARRRRSASVVAALRSERPVGTTLAASMDGGAMAAAAVASAGFTATWSAGRREDGQPAGYAHRALAADTPARTAGVRPDLAYLEAATPELGEAAPALGEPLTRVVRGGRRGAAVGRNGDVDAGLEGTSGGMPSEERGPTRLGRAGAGAPVRGTEPTAARSSAGPTPSLAGVGRAGNALFTALARSTTAAEVATVLLDAPGAAAAELAEALPEPAARAVYEVTRMRTLPESEAAVLAPGPARQGGGAVAQAASASSSSSNLRATLAAGVRRVRRSGGGGGPTTVGQDGHGEGRLMKLSQKLLGLIHLAERQQTDATRQVRRSDEKVGAASQGRAGQVEGADGVTLASLQREVLEAVQRELERSRERGEGGRYGDFWW